MRTRCPQGDRGEITLPGLLVAMSISLIVMLAVLDTFDNAQRQSTELTARNGDQQSARVASDAFAAALRNLASPTPDQPQAIDVAGPYDLTFQDVDPAGPNAGQNTTNVRRTRWCLDTAGTVWQQRQTWVSAGVPAVPSTASCPGSGWPATVVAVQKVTNRLAVPPRPLFTYDAVPLTDIASVHVDLQLDEDPTRAPGAVQLATGVFLRNQNRRPVAAFTATKTAQGIVLNASASADPEGHLLTYAWRDAGTTVGSGVTMTYKVTAGTSRPLSVEVRDPAGLTATSPVQVVVG